MASLPQHLLPILLLLAHLGPSVGGGAGRHPAATGRCLRRAGGPGRLRPPRDRNRHTPGRRRGREDQQWHFHLLHRRLLHKFVEAGGARVIPLIYSGPDERLLEKLSLVNGVLFTGGSVKRGPYFEKIKKVFQYVLDKNDAGVPFPLFAQCLGFELDNNILESFHASDQASTLQFPNYSSLQGSVFERHYA